MKIIAIELSGSPKLYNYIATDDQLVNRSVGDRVVIPNKLKEDGSLSLSIGTFKGYVHDAPLDGLKWIVQFIDAACVRAVQVAMLRAESAEKAAQA